MTFDRTRPDDETRKVSLELMEHHLQRISEGDPAATYDLANFWMMHVFDRDFDIELGIVEGLMRQSAQLGNEDAKEFLAKLWPIMRPLLVLKRDRFRAKLPR